MEHVTLRTQLILRKVMLFFFQDTSPDWQLKNYDDLLFVHLMTKISTNLGLKAQPFPESQELRLQEENSVPAVRQIIQIYKNSM